LGEVNKICELQGWRKAEGEELKAIQGYFIKDALHNKQNGTIVDGLCVIFASIAAGFALTLYEFITKAYKQNEVGDTIILMCMMIGCILVSLALAKTIIKSKRKNRDEKYISVISNNEFMVNDIEIKEIIFHQNTISGFSHYWAKVMDLYGNCYEEEILFERYYGYKKTKKALLISFPLTVNENDTVYINRILAYKEDDENAWNIGIKNYNKFVNKKIIRSNG